MSVMWSMDSVERSLVAGRLERSGSGEARSGYDVGLDVRRARLARGMSTAVVFEDRRVSYVDLTLQRIVWLAN